MTSAFGTCIYLRFHNIHSTDTPQMMQFQIMPVFKKVNKNENSFFELHAKFSLAGMKCNDMNVTADNVE